MLFFEFQNFQKDIYLAVIEIKIYYFLILNKSLIFNKSELYNFTFL